MQLVTSHTIILFLHLVSIRSFRSPVLDFCVAFWIRWGLSRCTCGLLSLCTDSPSSVEEIVCCVGIPWWGSAPCSTFEAKTVSLTDKNFSCRQSGHKWIDALPKSNLSIVGNVLLIAHAFAMPVFFLIRHNQNYG